MPSQHTFGEMNMTLDTFDLETEKGCNSEDVNDDLGGSPPHDMAAANRILSCVKRKTTKLHQYS